MKSLFLTLALFLLTNFGYSQLCISFQDTSMNETVFSSKTTFVTSNYVSNGITFKTKYFDYLMSGSNGSATISDHVLAGYTGSGGATNFAGNIYYQGNVITQLDFTNMTIAPTLVEFDINYYDTMQVNPFRINGGPTSSLPLGISLQSTRLTNGFHIRITGAVNTLELHGFEVGIDNVCADNTATSLINNQRETDLSISLFPNPTDGIVTLNTDKTENMTFEILNNLGQIVMSTSSLGYSNTLDLTHLPKGIYLFNIKNEGLTIKTERIVKIK